LSIDSDFQKNRKKIGKEEGVAIWGPVSPPEKLGIRGTYVAVDWDICTGCGVCLKVCPQQLYEWMETSGHPTSEKKAFPARESDCVQCYECEAKCPAQAGVLFGPSLGLQTLFYVGWLTLPVALFFFFSLIIYFRKEGKPGEGKGLMNTTVLVDSGTSDIHKLWAPYC